MEGGDAQQSRRGKCASSRPGRAADLTSQTSQVKSFSIPHTIAMAPYHLCRACARQGKRLYSTNGSHRDYAAAVRALNSLQSNFSIVEAIRKMGPGWNKRALPEMRSWVRRIGYKVGVHVRRRGKV